LENPFPDIISTVDELELALSTPYAETVELMKKLKGDLLILGVAGKMGVSLAHMARRACRMAGVKKRIIGVSRFTNENIRTKLEQFEIETVKCNLVNLEELERVPSAENIIFMAGHKFAKKGSEQMLWMINTVVPANVCKRFPNSNMVAFSTGCVYPLVSPETGGSRETDAPLPIGEYANSCLGREKIFEYFSAHKNTRVLLFRLNYAIDLRYGVLLDIGEKVFKGEPVDISVSHVNVIWQGDANNRALLCLKKTRTPPAILNITGGEILSVTEIAKRFATLMGKKEKFKGKDFGKAYLSNASLSMQIFGEPKVTIEQMIKWTAEWLKNSGTTLGKPTLFNITDGRFFKETQS